MDTGIKERLFYEIEDNWENFTRTPIIDQKVHTISEMIPPGVQSLLDIGCGNGLITNCLADSFKITGLDWSLPALRYVSASTICGSVTSLPMKPGRFDMILCSELLEHLVDEDFKAAIEEIRRLDIRYLLVSVPNNENTHINELICPVCQEIFNASHHYRGFTLENLSSCFRGYQLRESRVGGPGVRSYPMPLLRLRQRLGRRWFQVPTGRTVICPKCENKAFPRSHRTPLSFICDGLNRLISRRHPYWLYALYEIAP